MADRETVNLWMREPISNLDHSLLQAAASSIGLEYVRAEDDARVAAWNRGDAAWNPLAIREQADELARRHQMTLAPVAAGGGHCAVMIRGLGAMITFLEPVTGATDADRDRDRAMMRAIVRCAADVWLRNGQTVNASPASSSPPPSP